MANDKLVNREVLKEVREKFQQKIENATIVAGQARTIAAVSEESGTMQDVAFINQGTGTANNTELVDTSPVGKNIQKEGYSIVYNQWNNSSYTNHGFSASGQHITLNKDDAPASVSNSIFQLPTPIPAGHKILEIYIKKSGVLTGNCNISGYHAETGNNSWATYAELTTMANGTHYKITTLSKSYTNVQAFFYSGYTITENLDLYYYVIDLTQWFNGDIPSDLSNDASHFSWYYNGDLSYNVGQIKDCNGRYLECGQGRQIWDEQWEAGNFDTITGENNSGTGIRSKNLIRVNPNTDYYGWCGSSGGFWVMFLDKDENVIPLSSPMGGTVVNNVVSIRENVIKTPANAVYAKFYISSEYGSTYKHDITISLYYESGDSYYGHYYPYVPPVTYDTGNEVLRSIPVAGGDDIKDIKEPDGTIIKRVGTRAYTSGDENDSSVLTDGTTTYYALATPTTEQGTAFIDNIQINDYSYMLWKDTNEDDVVIPQGVTIFYPADYVLDMDTLHTYTDGDMTKIVLKGELSLGDPDTLKGVINLYDIMQQNIGGTLRHQLADKASVNFDNTAFVDLGTLSWTRNAEKGAFYATISDAVDYSTNCICTKYPTVQMSVIWTGAQDDCCSMQNNYIGSSYNKRIVIRDTSYTDATAFKTAMKGILLAYEKA